MDLNKSSAEFGKRLDSALINFTISISFKCYNLMERCLNTLLWNMKFDFFLEFWFFADDDTDYLSSISDQSDRNENYEILIVIKFNLVNGQKNLGQRYQQTLTNRASLRVFHISVQSTQLSSLKTAPCFQIPALPSLMSWFRFYRRWVFLLVE